MRPDPGRRPSGRRGRRHGIEIRPGTVKQARAEAGLSLAQVAGDAISRTAIYFVETGKAKPSMETLKLIAERTGPLAEITVSHLITGAAGLLRKSGDHNLVRTAEGDPPSAFAAGHLGWRCVVMRCRRGVAG